MARFTFCCIVLLGLLGSGCGSGAKEERGEPPPASPSDAPVKPPVGKGSFKPGLKAPP